MSSSAPIRLQKLLASHGLSSRREAEDLIRKKKITINGQLATLGDRASHEDTIKINGKLITFKKPKKLILAYHKPEGIECTLAKIKDQKTLADVDFGEVRVFPIGRLDTASRGLLLLTNDGDLANKLMHPRYKHKKEYLVTVNKEIDPKALKKMESGIQINGKTTKKCETELLKPKSFRIVLTEGRNRQIRKMCEFFGWQVRDLIRIRVEKIKLGELPAGKWRVLSQTEMKSLRP